MIVSSELLNPQGMIDTNGFNEIEAAANKAKKFLREGTWHVASEWIGWVQFIIREKTSNIDVYNILNKVKPLQSLDSLSSKYISSRSQGMF